MSETIIGAFTEEQAARLSRLSIDQLRYWNRTGFFKPDLADPNFKGPYNRIYSFRNIVGLRILGTLRGDHNVSLQHLRKVAAKLEGMDQSLWNTLTLYVRGREVYTPNGIGGFQGIVLGEDTLPKLPLPRVMCEVEAEISELKRRPDDAIGKITRDRNVARNAEIFSGTRIPVDVVREYFEAGYSIDDILTEYPTLTASDINAALRHLGIKAA